MNIGQKVRELRIAKNLTQEELADRSELSKGFISQLERDLTSPSIATLVDILQCLGTNLNEFFSDDEEEQVVFGDEDYFEKKDTDLKNTIEWIIPNAQRNMMENSVELPFIRCKGCNVLSIENYFSGVRIFESAEDTQKRCLSAAARS